MRSRLFRQLREDAINTGLLKLNLLLKGIQRTPKDWDWPEETILVLPENTWVNISQGDDSPYQIQRVDDTYRVTWGEESVEVRPILTPAALQKKTASGHRVGDLIHFHGGFLAAVPRGPCRFAKSGLACKYCGTKATPHRTDYTNEDFVEALQILLKETPAEIVHLSSGFVESEDGGIAQLIPLVGEIRKHINILVSVSVMPPASNAWIDRTYASGVDMVYYDLDVFDPVLFAATYPEKDQKIRHERFLKALEYAVKIFPRGAVTSHLVLGLEPLESTIKGINSLTDLGVVPLVTFFPPVSGSTLASRWQPDVREIIPVYAYLYDRIVAKRLSTNWIRQIDVVLTPLEGRHFAGGKARMQVAIKNFYHTGIGRKAGYVLAAMRRKLRVREVKSS